MCAFLHLKKNDLIQMKQLVNKGSNRGNFETVKGWFFLTYGKEDKFGFL